MWEVREREATERFSEEPQEEEEEEAAYTNGQTKLAIEISMDAAMVAVLRLMKNKKMALMVFLGRPTHQEEALNHQQQM